MPNWAETMQQTFEYYEVDPGTWKDRKKLTNVKSCKITRDSDTSTLGSATIEVTDALDECYVRVYLVTIQNGITEKFPLGTFLVQTPSISFDGKVQDISLDAYTPLIELKEKLPPLGYSILKGDEILTTSYRVVRENARAPVVEPSPIYDAFGQPESTITYDFVAETDDTWLSFLTDFLANAKYSFGLDELGRIIFEPNQDLEALQPIWTYNDDNSSILYPDVTLKRDLYDIPNVVEVYYTDSENSKYYYSRKVNDDPNSPTSTVVRGREKAYRDTNPSLYGNPTQTQIDEYAEQLLKGLSTMEYTLTYSHGYCPVRLGDCVRLNYTRAGLNNIKAKVTSQTIECDTGCKVTETAVFTTKLWG